MPRSRAIQTNFSAGELDPLLLGRPDTEQYGGGAEILENMIVLPQGGVTRRPGTKFVGLLNSNVLNFRLAGFEFNISEFYVLVFEAGRITIYRNDSVEQIIADATVPYLESEIPDLYWTQTADTMIVVHPDHAPRRLLRDTTQFVGFQFSMDAAPITGIPVHDFDDTKSPVAADETQTIQFDGAWTSVDYFQLRVNGVTTGRITYSADTTILAQRIEDHIAVSPLIASLSSSPLTGIVVSYIGGSGVPGDFLVTFGGASGGRDWDPLTSIISTKADATASINIIPGTSGGSREEPVWSALFDDSSAPGRGWPSTVILHEGRLWFGGSKSRPISMWGSKAGQFFNFTVGTAQDEDAIDITLNTSESEGITHLHSTRHLQVFSTSGEFYIPEVPITPTNIVMPKQTDVGITPGIKTRPVTLDGATLFIDREGKGVHQFVFGFAEEAYNTDEISLVSQHLIRNPVAMSVHRDVRGNFAYVVNKDGTMAVLTLHRSQSVAGWTRWTTFGFYQDVVTVARVTYVVVQRVIAGLGIVRMLERVDPTFYTDAGLQVVGAQSEIFTGYGHLSGETVPVRINDESPIGKKLVAGATIVTGIPADLCEAGLEFNTHVRPMPPVPEFQDGLGMFRMRRPTRYWLELQNSADVLVDGWRIGDRIIGTPALDEPPPLLNGSFNVRLRGWSRKPRIDITQTLPMPLTLVAIGYDGLESS